MNVLFKNIAYHCEPVCESPEKKNDDKKKKSNKKLTNSSESQSRFWSRTSPPKC